MNRRYVLSVLVDNHAGVLSRVVGLFSRRGFNISSLTVGETTDSTISRITIMLFGDEYILDQIKKQLNKLEDVRTITEIKQDEGVFRELVLIKVEADDKTRPSIVEIANIFRAKVVDIATDSLTMEITGELSKAQAFIELMEPYKIKEIARTGLTALQRGSRELNKHTMCEED
jgi:acetolactate synthase-1/3 small subunit